MSKDIKRKQWKVKRKNHIFSNELDGFSNTNWKTSILSTIEDAYDFSQLDKIIQTIEGGILFD